MKIDVYDEDGYLIQDEVRREKYLLNEESKRIKAFLRDAGKILEFEADGANALASVVGRLERICREAPDSDLAPDARRLLNQAACIDLDISRHVWYIKKKEYPIDTELYLS